MNRTAEEWKRHYEKESPCEHAIIVELYPEAVADILELDTQAKEQAARIAALEAERDRLRETLKYYAVEQRYRMGDPHMGGGFEPSQMDHEAGARARAALAATPAPKPDEALRLLRNLLKCATSVCGACALNLEPGPDCPIEQVVAYLAKHGGGA